MALEGWWEEMQAAYCAAMAAVCPDGVCGDHYDPSSDNHCPDCHA